MKNNTILLEGLQVLLTEEEVEKIAEAQGYKVKARKLTVYDLLKYLIVISHEGIASFRRAVDYANSYGLPEVDHSKLSGKASEVPYEIFKELFEIIIKKCNRKTRRSLKINKDILAIDSTTITTSKTQLKWAGFHGKSSGVKLHVQFNVDTYMPTKVEESI